MYSYDNYDPGKPYVYYGYYYGSDESYDYVSMDISEPNRHAAKLFLPSGVNPSVNN